MYSIPREDLSSRSFSGAPLDRSTVGPEDFSSGRRETRHPGADPLSGHGSYHVTNRSFLPCLLKIVDFHSLCTPTPTESLSRTVRLGEEGGGGSVDAVTLVLIAVKKGSSLVQVSEGVLLKTKFLKTDTYLM